MNISPWKLAFWLSAIMALNTGAAWSQSQAYPSRPVRVVTTGAGGAIDVALRILQPSLSDALKQPILIENSTGVVAVQIVSHTPPDGYTLYVGGDGFWLAPLLQEMPYDPVKDFTAITLFYQTPSILVVNPSLPVRSVQDLIALAKSKPGELNYSSSLTGGSNHLAAELFKAIAGVNIVRVPYKSGETALNAVISGDVQVSFATLGTAKPQLGSGKIKALAVTSAQPTALLPGLPTVAATGLPGYEYTSSQAFFAPAGTPTTIVNRLNSEIVRSLNRSEVKDKFLSIGLDVATDTPSQLAAMIKAEMARMGKVIKDAGIRAN